MPVLLHPAYFPSIYTFSILSQKDVIWEVWDNYQKQTYRNRCYICTDQGRLMLNIPILHVGGAQGRQRYRDVQIDHSSPWPKQHWKTLQTAYRSSPFFEYFEDDLAPLFEQKEKFLLEFNLRATAAICDLLQITFPDNQTSKFQEVIDDCIDGRHLIIAKQKIQQPFEPYTQVFEERHGFLSNLSILDLLFNEGSNALSYLQGQDLDV